MEEDPAAIARLALGWSAWSALAVGGPLNTLCCWLIARQTPKEMAQYSKMLLFNCFIDLGLLLVSAAVQPANFVLNATLDVIQLVGPVAEHRPHPVQAFLWPLWLFLFLFSTHVVNVQFITRHRILNLNKNVPVRHYAAMLLALAVAFALAMLGYCWTSYTSGPLTGADCKAKALALIAADESLTIRLRAFGGSENRSTTIEQLTSCVDLSTVAIKFFFVLYLALQVVTYTLIITLGFKMWHYVRRNMTGHGATNPEHIHHLNNQLTINLCVQAALPALSVLAACFNLIVPLLVEQQQQQRQLEEVAGAVLDMGPTTAFALTFWLPALNPLVTLATVRPYRRWLWTCGHRRQMPPPLAAAQIQRWPTPAPPSGVGRRRQSPMVATAVCNNRNNNNNGSSDQ